MLRSMWMRPYIACASIVEMSGLDTFVLTVALLKGALPRAPTPPSLTTRLQWIRSQRLRLPGGSRTSDTLGVSPFLRSCRSKPRNLNAVARRNPDSPEKTFPLPRPVRCHPETK